MYMYGLDNGLQDIQRSYDLIPWHKGSVDGGMTKFQDSIQDLSLFISDIPFGYQSLDPGLELTRFANESVKHYLKQRTQTHTG